MKNLILVAAFTALAFGVIALGAPISPPTNAYAADGGPLPVKLLAQSTYRLECSNPSCYRFSTDGGLAVCGTDSTVPGVSAGSNAGGAVTVYQTTFQSAGANYLFNASANDGGVSGCRLFLDTLNLPR